ncbi:MAG: hypothetical protein AAFY60_11460 [Myxococcota bacterium]
MRRKFDYGEFVGARASVVPPVVAFRSRAASAFALVAGFPCLQRWRLGFSDRANLAAGRTRLWSGSGDPMWPSVQ